MSQPQWVDGLPVEVEGGAGHEALQGDRKPEAGGRGAGRPAAPSHYRPRAAATTSASHSRQLVTSPRRPSGRGRPAAGRSLSAPLRPVRRVLPSRRNLGPGARPAGPGWPAAGRRLLAPLPPGWRVLTGWRNLRPGAGLQAEVGRLLAAISSLLSPQIGEFFQAGGISGLASGLPEAEAGGLLAAVYSPRARGPPCCLAGGARAEPLPGVGVAVLLLRPSLDCG